MAGPGDFLLLRNTPIADAATSNTTSQVGEPSVANSSKVVLLTGNWYASLSKDSGATWGYINPYTFFPTVNGGFCCDQVAMYDPSRDLLFWLLQYVADGNRNTLRLAISRGADQANNLWYYYDFAPDGVNSAWTKQWFDYPDLALSKNYLYVTSNMFATGATGGWTRSVVLRLRLDQLAARAALTYGYYATSTHGSLKCTQGAKDTMYFGAHNASPTSMRVFSWPETSTAPTFKDVSISSWSNATRKAPGPDGRDWCARADQRMTGAWVAGGVIGFMWSAAQAPPSRPFPYVRVVRVNESSKALIDQPDIWNPNFAWMYPTVSPNDRGHVGLSLFYGGGTSFPSHAAGIDDDFTPNPGWAFVTTAVGTHGPGTNKWGDYVACRRHSPEGLTWVATGFTQQGGSDAGSIQPRYIHFGRRRDRAAAQI